MVTVPPVGPPVVVPIGRALFQNSFPLNKSLTLSFRKVFQYDPSKYLQAPEIILDKRFDVPQNSFYLDINEGMHDERRIFANGTILYRYCNTFLLFHNQINSVDNKNLDASLIIIIKSETCFFNSLYRLVYSSLAKSSISCNKSVIPGKAAPPYALNLLGANMAFLVSGHPTSKIL